MVPAQPSAPHVDALAFASVGLLGSVAVENAGDYAGFNANGVAHAIICRCYQGDGVGGN
jgi:hypothetical protein